MLSTKKEGNEKEIRDLLIQMIETDITNDSDLYRFGTKTADEIECTISDDDGTAIELHGYTVYKDYHIDYTARLFDAI